MQVRASIQAYPAQGATAKPRAQVVITAGALKKRRHGPVAALMAADLILAGLCAGPSPNRVTQYRGITGS